MNPIELEQLIIHNKERATIALSKYTKQLQLHNKQYKQRFLHHISWRKKKAVLILSISNMYWVIEYSTME